jgi:hypothetical protein
MNGFEFIHCSPTSELESIVFVGFALEFCDVSALQAQNKITGQSRQILFEGLPPQTQDFHGFFRRSAPVFSSLLPRCGGGEKTAKRPL